VKLGAAWLLRDEHQKVRAFSTVCPHLGCSVDWNPQTTQFECPCHQSHFDGEGHCLSGPSPRDLDELEVVTTADEVKIRYQRFKLSTPTKELLG
jgi:Rieske Fe-S protein